MADLTLKAAADQMRSAGVRRIAFATGGEFRLEGHHALLSEIELADGPPLDLVPLDLSPEQPPSPPKDPELCQWPDCAEKGGHPFDHRYCRAHVRAAAGAK